MPTATAMTVLHSLVVITEKIITKDRLQALRIILQADIARFESLCKG
jgi:hypothetical protein